MGVLPDRSKKIVPTPYHDLMVNPHSPIIDFYPRDFQLDMNGKKMEWEAVVKIPFIDEKRLLAAMALKDHLLTEAERARNDFGVSLKFSYSPDMDFTYPSSMVGVFPDLPHCHCIVNVFELPTIEGLKIHHGLMPGVKLGSAALAGFPSLQTLPYVGSLGSHGVNVFQQDSRNESMLITLTGAEAKSKVTAARQKLGSKVHVGYPFLQEALVVRVSDELFNHILPESGPGDVVSIPHSPQEIDAWRKKANRIGNNYSKRLGFLIGPVESLVHVDMLKGLRKTDDGATVKDFAQIPGMEVDYASQTVVDEVLSEDQRFLEEVAKPIEVEFPEGTRAFFLGEFNYGRPLEVVRHYEKKAEVWVSIVKGREPEFGREIVTAAENTIPYIPSYAVARMLNLNGLVLSKITSAFSVVVDGSRVNLGLNLKFEAKKLKVLGYSRRGQSGWEFSQKAIELLQEYMIKFPEFIAGIQRNPKGDLYQPTDFYPGDTASMKIKEIQAWLRSVESKAFEKVPLDAEQLDSDIVHLIEQAADKQVQNGPPVEGKKIKGVPRSALLKPADAESRLGNQSFSIGDRIVYVQDSGRVPIATRGTVVGLTRTPRTTLLDVVFDVTFMSGTTLGDRCSPFRGSTVPFTSALNITNRQLISGSKAAADHRPFSNVKPSTLNGYGTPLGLGGRGQLVEARVPPPIRGSFRNAVASQQNGARTYGLEDDIVTHQQATNRNSGHNGQRSARANFGSDSRGRFSQTSMTRRERGGLHRGLSRGPEPRNPASQLQQYSTVAPPQSLDSRGRGRGRAMRGNAGSDFRGRSSHRARGGPVLEAQLQ